MQQQTKKTRAQKPKKNPKKQKTQKPKIKTKNLKIYEKWYKNWKCGYIYIYTHTYMTSLVAWWSAQKPKKPKKTKTKKTKNPKTKNKNKKP